MAKSTKDPSEVQKRNPFTTKSFTFPLHNLLESPPLFSSRCIPLSRLTFSNYGIRKTLHPHDSLLSKQVYREVKPVGKSAGKVLFHTAFGNAAVFLGAHECQVNKDWRFEGKADQRGGLTADFRDGQGRTVEFGGDTQVVEPLAVLRESSDVLCG
jgi:hypothetical protein